MKPLLTDKPLILFNRNLRENQQNIKWIVQSIQTDTHSRVKSNADAVGGDMYQISGNVRTEASVNCGIAIIR